MRTPQFLSAAALGFGLFVCAPAAPSGAGGPAVSGGGLVNVTDIDGNWFPLAGEFSISGGVEPTGDPYGRINFVFGEDFASFWGAVPGVTQIFRLTGHVADVAVDDDVVTLSGLLTETDLDRAQGVIFVEEQVPFEIVAEAGSNSFVMQFCELPPFVMEVAKGRLSVRAISVAAGATPQPLLRRVVARSALKTMSSRPMCST